VRLLLLIFLFPLFCLAQSDSSLIKEIHIAEGDTFISTELKSIDVLSFKTKEDKRYYHRLKQKTLKVYPYALLAAHKLDSIEADLAQIPKRRKRKKYIKAVDRWVKEDLGEELKKLTRWEGRILVKLIHRETGISPYYILKDYRGNWQAFLWQQFAKLYDNNLKSQYQPESVKEDRLIEHILLEAENNTYFPKRR
jgi:hypothetical protein